MLRGSAQQDTHGSARPLIFLGHSFGGLVIEQAIVMASSVASPYVRLLDYLGGVILFGTPHKGSKLQKWGAIMAQLAQMIEYGETILMDDVDEHSMKIFDLRFDFMQIVIRTGLAEAIVCFCENRPTNYLRRTGPLGGLLRDRVSVLVCRSTSYCWVCNRWLVPGGRRTICRSGWAPIYRLGFRPLAAK